MKKKVKKLSLHRETLHFLDNLHQVVGGGDTQVRTDCITHCASNCTNCGGESGSGDYTIFATCGACSNDCATGGACTVTC